MRCRADRGPKITNRRYQRAISYQSSDLVLAKAILCSTRVTRGPTRQGRWRHGEYTQVRAWWARARPYVDAIQKNHITQAECTLSTLETRQHMASAQIPARVSLRICVLHKIIHIKLYIRYAYMLGSEKCLRVHYNRLPMS